MQNSFSKCESQYFRAVDALLSGQGFPDDFHFACNGINPGNFLDFDRNVPVGRGERSAVNPLLLGLGRCEWLPAARPTGPHPEIHCDD